MQSIITLLALLLSLPVAAGEPLRVAVAANFRGTLETINAQYTRDTGQQVLLSSASSGVLANQVIHGAPFDLFFSADRTTAEALLTRGNAVSTRCYAQGSLVLLGGTLDALSDSRFSLAIGNPATAPYGRAAMEVLARPEYDIQRSLIRGNNVLQAYQFWRAGATDLALVARALEPGATPVPVQWHQPVEQHLALLSDSPEARAYLLWLGSDTVRGKINNAGYLPCP